jgi:hypothetical protein
MFPNTDFKEHIYTCSCHMWLNIHAAFIRCKIYGSSASLEELAFAWDFTFGLEMTLIEAACPSLYRIATGLL